MTVRLLEAPTMSPSAVSLANMLASPRTPLAASPFEVRLAPVPAPEGIALWITVAGHPARFWLPQSMADTLLASLDPAAPASEGEARELLVLLAALPFLAKLSASLSIGFDAAAVPEATLASSTGLAVQWDGGEAVARLDLSNDAVGEFVLALKGWPATRRRVPVPIVVHLRLAAMSLTTSEARSLLVGDVVLPDAGDGNTVAIITGETLAWRGRLSQEGVVTETRQRLATELGLGDWLMQDDVGAGPGAADATLDELPVRLGFELGRLEMSLADLERVGPGYVFTLPRADGASVDIVANGRRIGQGEVVMVGDALGVRVLRLAGR